MKFPISKNAANQQRGMTILELAVVAMILAVLTTIALSIYLTFTKNSKDQGKWRDLTTIKQALEMYRYENQYYPQTLPSVGNSLKSPTDSTKVYLDAVPGDQTTGFTYQYLGLSCTAGNCIAYVYCAKKEGTNTFNNPSNCASLTCTSGGQACDMGVQSD